jgi:hypothetical protein
LVIREIWRPELDPVRQTYADDPDGGVLDEAPDAGWIEGLRRRLRVGSRPDAVAEVAPTSAPPTPVG